MTLTITGRNRYSSEPLTRVTIREPRLRATEVLVIEGGYIEARGDGFQIAAKHPTANDEEGDSAYVAILDGAGLVWKDMVMGDRHIFTGVLLKAQYVEDETAQAQIEGLGHLPFTPPERKWKPGVYEIEVRHLGPRQED